MRKKNPIDETNPLNELFHALKPERKERARREVAEEEDVLPDDMKELEEKKRARYEVLKEKYK